MNIKGASRAGGKELAAHLMNAEKNEKVTIVRVDGTVAQDLPGAFAEMEAVGSGTQCRKPLYHAKISPDPKEPRLTPEQWDRAVEALAKELGMEGHAYVFVLHQKYGKFTPDVLREHGHVVFNRIDADTMRAVHDGHNYRKHEVVSRQLEQEFGHARIQGAHVGRENGEERPQRTPPDWSMQRAAVSGIDPRQVAGHVKQLWQNTGTAHEFADALKEAGLTLAVGKRDLVILDQAGDVHTLARCLNLKVADIRERLADIDRSTVPTVDQARDLIREQKAQKEVPTPVWDRDKANADWMDAVINAAIGKEEIASRSATSPPPTEDRPRDAVRALAETLHREKENEKIAPADAEALREKLAGLGFDAAKVETLEKWRQLDSDVDAGRITAKDRLRDMALYLWHEGDKERRAEQKGQSNEPQQEGHQQQFEPEQ